MWLSLLGLVCGYVSKRINSLELESTAIDAGCRQMQKSTTKVGHETRSAILLYPSEQKVAMVPYATGRQAVSCDSASTFEDASLCPV